MRNPICILCRKWLPRRSHLKAHENCLVRDEVESILERGWWVNPVTGEVKGDSPWLTHGTETGRTSSALPNMQNLQRASQKMRDFAQTYGMSAQKISEMLSKKTLLGMAGIDFAEIEQRTADVLKRDTTNSLRHFLDTLEELKKKKP